MRKSKKQELIDRAESAIENIKSKGYNQIEIASFLDTTPSSISKLKGIEYLPTNAEQMIEKLEALVLRLEKEPPNDKKKLWQRKVPMSIFMVTIILLLITLFFNIFFVYKEKKRGVREAFLELFESDMQVILYLEKPELPCYRYQGKWELDEKKPYLIKFPTIDGTYYYKSKSVDFYAWCDVAKTKGDKLNALEFFVNEIWKDEREMENKRNPGLPDFNDPQMKKIAEINSIFSDVINIEIDALKKDTIISREGNRIVRYFPPNYAKENYEIEVDRVINNYVSKLEKTDCSDVKIFDNKELIMQFDCSYSENQDDGIPSAPYSKRLRKVE